MWYSRTVCLAGLALGLVGGCVIDETDDSAFAFQWQLEYVGGGRAACDTSGTPTVHLQVRHQQTANTQAFTWLCNDGRAVTPVLPLGRYDVTVSLLDRRGRSVSAIDGQVSVERHGLTQLGSILFKVQIFQFSWVIVQEPPGGPSRPLNCNTAGAYSVEMVTQLASEDAEKFEFPCDQGEGITEAVRVGSYSYFGRLLNRAGQVLDETDVEAVLVDGSQRPALPARFVVP